MSNDLQAALAQFVQEHMPWPFSDVSRHDDEGTDAAWAIAGALLPHVEREFSGIVETAKGERRKHYPAADRSQGQAKEQK